MSAATRLATATARTGSVGGGPARAFRATRGAREAALALAGLAALTALASWRWADLLAPAPAGEIVAVAAIALAGGAAVALTADLRPRRLRGPLRSVLVLATLYVALRATGVSAHLLWPSHWGSLSAYLNHGFQGLSSGLWPYRQSDPWARRAVVMGLAIGLVPAAALAAWPQKVITGQWIDPARVARAHNRARRRRVASLGLVVAVWITAAVNEPRGQWALQGLLLLGALGAWLWLPSLRPGDALRALAWLAVAGAVAAAAASGVSGTRPWLNYHAWNPFRPSQPPATFQWDQIYGPLTWPQGQETMLEVTAAPAALWKVTTLDRFDGIRFLRSDHQPAEPPNVAPFVNQQALFQIRALRSNLLVGVGEEVNASPLSIDVPRFDTAQADGTITTGNDSLTSGDSYSVQSYLARPTRARLLAAPRGFPAVLLPYTQFELPAPRQSGLASPGLAAAARARLPDARTIGAPAPGRSPASDPALVGRILASPYARMYLLARRLAAGQRTTYGVVRRVDSFLHASYAYSLSPPARQYPLESFLFLDGRGYCQQFSGAMALLLRMDGIPTRVAVGFLPGRYDATDARWDVRAVDAHSWDEVYFSGIGWVTFDPTPPTTAKTSRLLGAGASGVAAAKALTAHSPALPTHGFGPIVAPPLHPGTAAAGPWSGLATVLAALLALCALAAGALTAIGHLRIRRGLTGDADGAVGELHRALRRLGHPIAPGTTLAELERRLSVGMGPPAGRYVAMLRERRFAAPGSPAAGGPVARDRAALRRALTAHGGPLARLRGLLALPPAMPRRRRMGSSAP